METKDWVTAGLGAIVGVILTLAVAMPWIAAAGTRPVVDLGQLGPAISSIGQAYNNSNPQKGYTYLLSADGTTLWAISNANQMATVWRMEGGGLRQVDDPRFVGYRYP